MKVFLSFVICISAIILIIDRQNNGTTTDLTQDKALEQSISRGKDIYIDFCMSCHLPTGEGIKRTYPPLVGSDYLKENRQESIRGIKYGQQGKLIVNGVTYNNVMAPMGLIDEEIADVMNYINHSWGNDFGKIVTTEEVSKITK